MFKLTSTNNGISRQHRNTIISSFTLSTSEWHTICKRNSCYTAVHKHVTIYFGHLR